MPDTQDVKTVEDEDLGIASEYDAFISYKHGPVDSAAAKALQKNLEHFHVPIIAGKIKGDGRRKKIRRVFLDEGELSAASAFASRIRRRLGLHSPGFRRRSSLFPDSIVRPLILVVG